MASTTNSQEILVTDEIVATTRQHLLQGWLILLLVFVAGAASLATEMAASRLLAPYFGDSLFVWSSIIGLILLYLTVGYYVGGQLSDRYPRPVFLYALTAAASILIALIPLMAVPLMAWTQVAFSDDTYGVLYGSLLSMLVFFALPTILLGCVSPFAIRIRMQQVGSAGRIAGQLYAISTAGSVIGTFLPVLVLLPYLGTMQTFLITALILFIFSAAGYISTRKASPQGQSGAYH